MKKVLLTTALVLVFAFSAFAQDDVFAPGLTGAGIKGGVALANLGGDVEETDMKLGFAAGGFVTFSFAEMFAVQPELLYVMKGAKSDVEFLDETFEVKAKLDYIQVPVLLKVMIPTQGNFKPFVMAGPAIAFLMNAEVDVDGESEDIKDFMKSTDFSAVLGAGFEYPVGAKGSLSFDARYDLGLSDIDDGAFDESIDDEVFDFEVKTTNIAVMVGYSFF